MKNLSLLILMTVIFSLSHAQPTSSGPNAVSRSDFNRIISQQFAGLVSPTNGNNLGNYASLDLKEAEVDLNGTVFIDSGSFLGIRAKGSVADGFLPMFENSSINTNLGLDLQYNFLRLGHRTLYYYNDELIAWAKKRDSVNAKYSMDSIEVVSDYEVNLLRLRNSTINQRLTRARALSVAATVPAKKDSIDTQIAKLQAEYDDNDSKIQAYTAATRSNSNAPNPRFIKLLAAGNARARGLQKVRDGFKVRGFGFGWWSVGYGLKSKTFKLFDSAQPFDDQVAKKTYVSHYLRVQYSYYRFSPIQRNTYYWSLGVDASIDDNQTELLSRELSETRNYGTNPGDRQASKKYNVYEGDYKTSLKGLSIHGDFYWFLFDDNKGALHFYPEYKVKDGVKGSVNIGSGLLMAFKKQDKEGNIVNAELYFKAMDVSNANNSEAKLLARSSLGLRFTFPINFTPKL